jgi:hypothetical protein
VDADEKLFRETEQGVRDACKLAREMTSYVNQGLCPYEEYKGQPCVCTSCRVIGVCVNPGEDGNDYGPCGSCDGPVQNCDPYEGLDEDLSTT